MNRLLINPIAGHGYAKKVSGQVIEALRSKNVEFDVVFSQYAGHTVELARESADRGDDTLFIMGGDGTVIESSRGVYGGKTAIAIIPCGTGNDFRRTLGVPDSVTDALDFALSHEARPVDCVLVRDAAKADGKELLYDNESGTGFEVLVLEYTNFSKRFLRGISAYLYGVIRAIATYEPVELEISLDDGTPFKQRVTLLTVCNGKRIGGGMEIAPMADPFDGYLDVIVIDALPKLGILKALPKLLNGTVMEIPVVHHHRCKKLRVAGDNITINTDGELQKMSVAEYRVHEGGLLIRA